MNNGKLNTSNGKKLTWLDRAKDAAYGEMDPQDPTARGQRIHALLEEIMGVGHALPESRSHIREEGAGEAVQLLLTALEGEIKTLKAWQQSISNRLPEWKRDLEGAPEKPQGKLTPEQETQILLKDTSNTMGWTWIVNAVANIRLRVSNSFRTTKERELYAAEERKRFVREGDAYEQMRKAS